MKVFYSWQADTDSRIGKQFIRQALDEAVDQLSEDFELDEADRPTVDQDTQGVLGSPPIAETIFEKIKESDVVVADVTLTCSTPSDKKLINSNVAYELGYAHGFHGHGVILKVMNAHFGQPADLPFDLRHRRWPLQYDLTPGASTETLREARASLVKEIARILRLYLEGRSPGKKYEPTPSTVNQASYWRDGEQIVEARGAPHRDEKIELGYQSDQPLCYLRIWPDIPLDDLTGAEIGDYNLSGIEPLLGRSRGYNYDRNRYGVISWGGREAQELIASTQLFRNREIWGVDAFVLRPRENYDSDFLATGAYETGMIRSINTFLKVAFEKLTYPDIVHVEAGMVNVDGFKLAMPEEYFFDRFWGPMYEDFSVRATVDRNDTNTINEALLKIFTSVFDAAGHERPPRLNNFP